MRNIIIITFLLFLGCQEEPNNLLEPTQNSSFYWEEEPLEYLNHTRIMCGLDAFAYNKTLEIAAKNHARYSVENNHHGHDENAQKSFFTGQNPTQRAFHAGYNTQVGENISFKDNFIDSIDSLLSAIYHRFAFLDARSNEIGFAKEQKNNLSVDVFVMGNSILNDKCIHEKKRGSGKFYINLCKNKEVLIDAKSFEKAHFTSHDFIVYPYDKAENILHYFSGETPDPMPTCKITANPVSIQFKTDKKKIELVDFKIFEDEKELKNTKLLTHQNDLNNKFTEFDFALFPLEVYKFNTIYKVKVSYKEDGQFKEAQWSFTTRSPKNPYFVVQGGESLKVAPNISYDLYFKPRDCNDLIEKYSSTYPSYAKLNIKQQDVNLLGVNFSGGSKGDKATISIEGREPIYLFLSSDSKGYKNDITKHSIIGGLILLLAILVGLFRRK